MAAHGCINCPVCKGGCSICGRCACTPEMRDAWLGSFLTVPPVAVAPWVNLVAVTSSVPPENALVEEDREQLPETD